MKLRLLLIAATAIMCFQVTELFSQDEQKAESSPILPGVKSSAIYFGPVVGYNRSLHSVSLSSFADPICPVFTNGNSNGYHVGIFYEQFIGGVKSKHSVVLRLLYNTMPSSLSHEGDQYPSLVKENPADSNSPYTTIISTTSHSIKVTYNTFTADVMYKFNVTSGFVLTIGPTFDLVATKTLEQKYDLIDPLNVQFRVDPTSGYKYTNNNRTIIVYSGDIGGQNTNKAASSAGLRVGIKMGIQYEIITGKKWNIIPGIFYNMGITDATSQETWKISLIQAGFDFRYTLGL